MAITKTLDFLPAVFQTETNSKFLGVTLDQLITEPNVATINGYIGRKFTPGWQGITSYIREPDTGRANYQLEPTVVVKNPDTSEVDFYGTYPDLLSQINYFNGNSTNQNELFRSEFYNFDPHINLDEFVNFGKYFWIPEGLPPVNVYSGLASTEKTFYVYPDSASETYAVSGFSNVENPTIVLVRGGTYEFVVNQSGKKFYIQTEPGLNVSNRTRIINGVTNNGDDVGTVTFNVPSSTAQEVYTSMPVTATVDFVTDLKFSEIDGIALSVIAESGGFDGISASTLVSGKSVIFSTDSTTLADWTSTNFPSGVPSADRWKTWTIGLTPSGSDYIVTLSVGTAVPTNNKVIISTGLTNADTQWYKNSSGYFTLIDPITAPLDTLYYQDSVVANEYGIIRLIDNTTNSIEIDQDILGKKNYVSPNGIIFTNGLKVKFDNTVSPTTYRNNEYYVEGVGTSIRLVLVSDLDVSAYVSRSNFDPTVEFTGATTSSSLDPTKTFLTITSNVDPVSGNIRVGTFPNTANPNYISSQEVSVTYPYRGGLNIEGSDVSNTLREGPVGTSLAGIPFYNTYNGWYINGTGGQFWHYNSSLMKVNGRDEYGGLPDSDDIYHYTDSQFITSDAWAELPGFTTGYLDSDGHSKLIGYAIDGYPIYGPYGYVNPADSSSGTQLMTSSYTVSSGSSGRPESKSVTVTANTISASLLTVSSTFGINPGMRLTFSSNGSIDTSGTYWVIACGGATAVGPEEFDAGANQIRLNTDIEIYANTEITFDFLPGSFIEDYSYQIGTGTLDQHNGRFCVTPDYPEGTYAYFATQNSSGTPIYPYVVGSSFYGSLSSDLNTSLLTQDYITINRASRDQNPWTRRNRWFHENVLEATANYNNTEILFSNYQRASRPIIDFNADLQLYDYGTTATSPVDIIDYQQTYPFIGVEGKTGIFLDQVNVTNGMRVIFANAADSDIAKNIYTVSFIDVDDDALTPKVIHLTLAETPATNTTVAILNGVDGAGKNYWFDGEVWQQGQQKLTVNQSPLFDVFDSDGVSLGDRTVYPVSNNQTSFNGTKIFSYLEGTGAPDIFLGFPLSYRNVGNQGDIQFVNNYDTDTFAYKSGTGDIEQKINIGLLRKNNQDGTVESLNVWQTIIEESKQYQHFGYDYDGLNNNFIIDVVPNANTSVPNLQVYVNFKKIKATDVQIIILPQNQRSISIRQPLIKANDRIDILVYSDSVSNIASYEVPDNLNLNASNAPFDSVTLGEMRSHIGEMTKNSTIFSGSFPGNSNLRDLNISAQPGSIVQQSSPVTYASMFLCNEQYNFVDAIYNAQQEYTRFKNKFLTIAAASNTVDINNPRTAVDSILKQINQVKNKTFPWFYSDMVPYGENKNTITYTVFDPTQRKYQITSLFTNSGPSNRAILVYLNGSQLLFNNDYVFSTTTPAIEFTSSLTLSVNDVITIYEYVTTDGSYIPETPSKLGLYPLYVPEISTTDNTYLNPTSFIIGHDGSKTPVFGDYRDNFLLELEKRIYNNTKVNYEENSLSIFENKPGKFRDTGYSVAEYNKMLSESFLKWIGFNRLNYITNSIYEASDPFTWNYGFAYDSDNEKLQGSWRACYEYFYDTQTPHLTPWEMLGFANQPDWWETRYGPAPYTSGNSILWDDLEAGYIAGGARQGYDATFARPGLSQLIPVDAYGQLKPPVGTLTSKYNSADFERNWSVGQWGPTETAWRNTSEWPYAQQIIMALAHPAKYFGLGVDTYGYRYNATLGQFVLTSTNYRFTPDDIKINGRINSDSTIQRSAGYINWINDLQTSKGILSTNDLYNYLTKYTVQLSYRMAGFSDKTLLKVLAEQYSPSSINASVIIPDQDFDLILGKSAPVRKIKYSAVIIKKTSAGFELSGYDNFNPSFTIVAPDVNGSAESISVINDSVNYYTTFNRYTLNVPYGTVFTSLQQLANFIAGYEQYLRLQGFRFDYYDEQLTNIRNWRLSVQELIFWKQQNWSTNSSIVLSPFANRGQVFAQNVFVDKIENSFFGTKVLDQNFKILGNNNYTVARSGPNFNVTIDSANSLIGYLELNLVQYEHVLIFNNITQFNDVIYNSATGQRQYRLKLVGQKTAGWDGTLSPEGFVYNNDIVPEWTASTDYLKGDLVEYKNFYYAASKNIAGESVFDFTKWLPVSKDKIKTGLLNNFATQANLGKDFYDIDKVNIESQADLLGFGLIGFRSRDYLYNAGVDDSTQVKFYQGFIKQKGSLNAVNAISNVTFNKENNQIELNEFWGFRVGEYGSLATNQFVELVLDEDYTLNNPTSLLVNSNNVVTYSSLYNSGTGLYNTAADPFTSPFLLNRTNASVRTDDIKTAGFVSPEDVTYTIFNIDDTSTFSGNINAIGTGQTIWTAIDNSADWNVYYVSPTSYSAVEITNALNNRISILTDAEHGLVEGDVIVLKAGSAGILTTGLISPSYFQGFYTVQSVPNSFLFTVSFNGDLTGFSRLVVDSPIYKLVSVRHDRASQIIDFTPTDGWTPNSKAWINFNTSSGDWGVYNKSEPWEPNYSLQRSTVYQDGNFGAAVRISTDNNFILVGRPGQNEIVNYQKSDVDVLTEGRTIKSRAPYSVDFGSVLFSANNTIAVGSPLSGAGNEGYVHIFQRDFSGELSSVQILSSANANVTSFGNSIAMSNDYQWLYIGAPESDSVFTYVWRGDVAEEVYTFTAPNADVATFTMDFIPTDIDLVTVANSTVDFVPHRDFTISGADITFTSNAQPDTYVIRQLPGYVNVTTATFTGNNNTDFGRSVSASTDGAQIAISAPRDTVNGNASAGSITIYDRTVENYIAIADQTTFGGLRPLVDWRDKVYLNGELQAFSVDYTITASTWVQFFTAPEAGSIVAIESNEFNLLQQVFANDPIAGIQMGYSVDLCEYNCSLYSGAPYYSSQEGLGKYYTGAVYRHLNQSRIYGTITGTVQNPSVTSGDSIRLNDYEVIFNDTTLDYVVSTINSAGIPGVTASNTNGYLKIDSDGTLVADKLRVLPGFGTALTDLGLAVFVQTQIIENPTNYTNDLFGKIVRIDETSERLAIASDVATTIMDTTFDVATRETTFDSDSTQFVDAVRAGAVWIFNLLGDSRDTITNPSKMAYVQQLKPNSIVDPNFILTEDMKFGSAIDLRNGVFAVGAKNSNSVELRSGIVSLFNNPNNLYGWDLLRYQEPKVDIDSIIKSYVYDLTTQTIQYNLDYIDPAKGKILGLAEQDITYKTDYDPAVYNNGSIDTISEDLKYFWTDDQVGKVWWDLSTVRFIEYEQGSIKFRTSNWGRTFSGSSIDVYEWVESIYPPSQYVANGGDGVPKYGNNEAYVTLGYVDPRTNQPTVKYYFWVKDKTTVTANQFGRTIPTITIANYIRNPKNSGVKYFAAIRNDAVAVYNLEKDVVSQNTILHIDYATQLNSNIIHSEYALLAETGTNSSSIPTKLYNKMVDSLSGIDASGNQVPDPTLPVQRRYGLSVRPRQGMFLDSSTAVKEMLTYVNSVFAQNLIGQGYDLTTIIEGEPIPGGNTGTWDRQVPTFEILTFINVNITSTGYRVLVDVDENVSNLWTIYTLQADKTWKLTRVQTYRPSDYWEYIDWYADGVDEYTIPDHIVDTLADISSLTRIRTGDIVKVLNNGQNKWTLLQVYANTVNTVGLQAGTIKLLDSLWDLATYNMSYDNDLFDTQRFDQNPSLELRKILQAIETNIFINELKPDFVGMFFTLIYYALNEQKSVDWVFKTSLVDVIQKIDGLKQPQIYARDNQDVYRSYIEEVKPYRTTIKEYITDYLGNDNWNGYTTDFDLPAYYDSVLKQYRSPSGEFVQDATALQRLEYRDWVTNYPYSITSIEVINGGSGYTSTPNVTITGSTINNNAVAEAIVTNGVVTKLRLRYPGTNYITQPVITISGGGGSGAKVHAILSGNPVRKIKTTLVYDRTTFGTTVLDWTPNTAYSQGDVITYGNLAYQATRSFTSGSTFLGNDLSLYVSTNFDNANDRIQSYYAPESGLPGKDFSLLQYGIDYPGVQVVGPLYTDAGGFDVGPFDYAPYDALSIDEDGTFIISDSLLDSKIESLYTDSSLGTRPEDIIIDGDNYVSNQVLTWNPSTYYPQGTVLQHNGSYYITNVGITSTSEFSTTNLMDYPLNPYTAFSSHAPEELVPGRVYDTLDITVSTLSVEGQTFGYQNWTNNTAFYVSSITIADGGSGYDSNVANITVTISGTTGTGATAAVTGVDVNGKITQISVISSGIAYSTVPNVTITGSNTSTATASVVLSQNTYDTFEYRIFKDMNDNYSYYRADPTLYSTTIAQNVTITSNTIVVANARALTNPAPYGTVPGVIYVNGERITFWTKDDSTNTLSNIRRGTLGTGANAHTVGEVVYDGASTQQVPMSSHYTATNLSGVVITTAGQGYTYNANLTYIRSNLWYDQGFEPIEIVAEPVIANVTANVLSTESNVGITTEGGAFGSTPTPTDGSGLFNSTTIQVLFIKNDL